ncbi:MAG: ABC transporter ATP-binding protein [Chloroflexi bacterium]|nr:ABC transporter ATP-binding protein [Chloroflexota bacterium]
MAEAIRFKKVSKRFILHHDKARSFQEMAVNLFRRNGSSEEFWALRNVSFSIAAGESIGLIGQNGSGKSTVLKLVSGILKPTTGGVRVNGRVSALLELGAGFHPDLTGKENVYLNGSILGLKRKEIDARFEEIVDFSELERFIDIPIKHYSSGMYMRLGFAVAVMTTPDILVIDEVLAVGDDAFRQKCLDKIYQMRKDGVTILFVSHVAPVVKQVCDRVLLLHNGELVAEGNPADVIKFYDQLLASRSGSSLRQVSEGIKIHRIPKISPVQTQPTEVEAQGEGETGGASQHAHPSGLAGLPQSGDAPSGSIPEIGTVKVVQARVSDGDGRDRTTFRSGEPIIIDLIFEAASIAETPNFIVHIFSQEGVSCHHTAARGRGLDLTQLPSRGQLQITYSDPVLAPGSYTVGVWVTRGRPDLPFYDRQDSLATFRIEGEQQGCGGLVVMPHEWNILPQPEQPAGGAALGTAQPELGSRQTAALP